MKLALQKSIENMKHPLTGMLVALAAICGFLAALVLLTVIVHLVMM